MSILVTVGTTHFEELIQAVDTEAFARAAISRGYSRIIIQYGPHAEYVPKHLFDLAGQGESSEFHLLKVDSFDITREFASVLGGADLVISHAGTGSIMEALSLGKRMIVVVNDSLMDNHQREIADVLSDEGHFYVSTPSDVVKCLQQSDFHALSPTLPAPDVKAFANLIDQEMGFQT